MTELRRSLRHEAVRRERRYRLRGLTKRASLAAFAGLCRAIIRLIRNRDPDRTARAAGRLMRAIGPRLRGHHVARANLKAALPEKSDQEIERVIDGVWDNLGRVLAEFAFVDRLTDYDPHKPSNKWILIDQAHIERGFEIAKRGGPYLVFGAHLANWELPPSFPGAFGIPFAGVYYPSSYPAADDLLIKIRSRRAKLIPARFGAAAQIENTLRQGSSIGMMVDLRFAGGTEVVTSGASARSIRRWPGSRANTNTRSTGREPSVFPADVFAWSYTGTQSATRCGGKNRRSGDNADDHLDHRGLGT
jgi:Kdo2-lipid IVA lauroyltransferase/acyltransferase